MSILIGCFFVALLCFCLRGAFLIVEDKQRDFHKRKKDEQKTQQR